MDLSVVGVVLGVFVSLSVIIGFIIQRNKDRDNSLKLIEEKVAKAKEDFTLELKKAQDQGDEKRAKIYTRLDEKGEKFETFIKELRSEVLLNYVPRPMCTLIHQNSDRIFMEIKDEIINLKKSIDRLYEKLPNKYEG